MASPRSLLDRVIGGLDPERAARRMRARAQLEAGLRLQDAMSGGGTELQALTGDSTTRDGFTDVHGVGGGSRLLRWFRPGIRDAAGDTLLALRMQRGQIRELVRTNPIAGGAIGTNVDRTVGTGLALVAQPAREVLGWNDDQALAWKRDVQTEFSLWADCPDCDWEGEQNFYDKQGLTLRSALESGDCFTILPDASPTPQQPYALRLQTLEADRVGNENNASNTALIAGGVQRSTNGGPKSYFVYDTHPGAIFTEPGKGRFTGQWYTAVGPSGRRRILHHFRQLRPEQPRGVPYLAPIIDHLRQLGRYTEAEVQAAIVSAFFTVFITSEAGPNAAPVFGASDAQVADDPTIEMGPGAVVGLAKGEQTSFADPSRPNALFDPFVKSIVWQIGVGLGLPYELLVKQFNASYSASKAALLDAWMWFRSQRTWLARSFCQPVYETWLAEAVATKRIAAPGFFTDPLMRWAYTRADWRGDSQGSINPKDEVAAYSAAVDERLMTRERATWELFGNDWYGSVDSMQAEQELLKAADLLPVPKAGAAAVGAQGDTPPDDTEPQQPDAIAAPSITIHNAAPQITVQPPSVEIHQAPISITLPESTIQLDAHITNPVDARAEITVQPASVQVDVPPVQVVIEREPSKRQVFKNGPDGETLEVVTTPID